MSYKSINFKAKQFDAIAKLVEELFQKEVYLNEYGVEIKTEEKIKCLLKIKEELEKPEPETTGSKDDRW